MSGLVDDQTEVQEAASVALVSISSPFLVRYRFMYSLLWLVQIGVCVTSGSPSDQIALIDKFTTLQRVRLPATPTDASDDKVPTYTQFLTHWKIDCSTEFGVRHVLS